MLAYTVTLCNRFLALSCSDGRGLSTSDYDEALAFMLQPSDYGVTWNVDALVDSLCSIMPKPLADKVRKGGRVMTPENRRLYYQAGRIFGINQINIFSLNRYADEPITDCHKLLELGEKVVEAYRTFGIEPTKLTSPVSLYSEILDRIPYPRACDLPDSAFPLLQECAETQSREWRDVYTLGHFSTDEITDYDLVSGYPSIIANLPDIRHAKFFESKTMPDNFSWGSLTGRLKINKPISPFICDKFKCYGMGEWDDQITTDGLWLLRKHNLGEFQLEHGNFFLLPKTYGFPFRKVMNDLYRARDSSNSIVSKIAKGISVGIGGKFAERHADGSLGDNFNSVYAKMTTSRCMVRVASFIYANHIESDVVSVLVDGFLATKRLPIRNQKVMGTWRVNEFLPALVLSLEYQWQGDKRPAYLKYQEIMDLIKEHPDRSNYGEVDIHLLSYNRRFEKLPRTGRELLANKYYSEPYQISAVS